MRAIAVPPRRPAMLPARLVALLALALALGAISLTKLRAGTAPTAIHQLEAEKKRLPAAGEHGTPAGEVRVTGRVVHKGNSTAFKPLGPPARPAAAPARLRRRNALDALLATLCCSRCCAVEQPCAAAAGAAAAG